MAQKASLIALRDVASSIVEMRGADALLREIDKKSSQEWKHTRKQSSYIMQEVPWVPPTKSMLEEKKPQKSIKYPLCDMGPMA